MSYGVIYRVEHPSERMYHAGYPTLGNIRQGVYSIAGAMETAVYSRARVEAYNLNATKHPNPFNDAGLCPRWEGMRISDRNRYVFGFSSMQQYRAWFMYPEGRAALTEKGMAVIGVYIVPVHALVVGQFQAIADSAEMHRVTEWPCCTRRRGLTAAELARYTATLEVQP